ncbi:MAG TPA: PrsW family glutamic-type intramembrane protease [Candidatus Eisenbacteria bacterium]|nr:PrsW family glutamic-type intramembrane protease [Candidatus Eisenbacteria bacterium]
MKERGPDRRQGPRRAGETAARPGERPPLVTCPHCGRAVPAGDFCGHCGAHLTTSSTTRRHAFAAVPSEHVAQLSIVSTLFPHLAHRRGGAFRWALVSGGAAVLLLAALHLFAPAAVVAIFLLPVLYLLYLYEVEVYEDEPWLVIGATMIVGAALGYAFSSFSGAAVSQLNLTGDRENAFVLSGVAIPIVAQALMLAGPLFLYAFRARFREPLDGLTFGAASALGFTLASSLTAIWPLIIGPLIGSGAPLDWSLRLLRTGILVALVNASTTGIVAAAVWLQRYDRRRAGRPWTVSILATLIVAIGTQVALGILTFVVSDLVAEVAIRLIATLALLLYVRLVIHQALLVEGAEHEIGPDAPCPECHRIVPTMAFCPACGAARAAASKQGRGLRPRRAV